MKSKLLLALSLLVGVALAQSQPPCNQLVAAPAVQIATGLTGLTFVDSTVVDAGTYGYVVTANDVWGYACSNAVINVVIPTTGTHSVGLSWLPSSTNGVTYAVFRATPPTSPSSLTATVN